MDMEKTFYSFGELFSFKPKRLVFEVGSAEEFLQKKQEQYMEDRDLTKVLKDKHFRHLFLGALERPSLGKVSKSKDQIFNNDQLNFFMGEYESFREYLKKDSIKKRCESSEAILRPEMIGEENSSEMLTAQEAVDEMDGLLEEALPDYIHSLTLQFEYTLEDDITKAQSTILDPRWRKYFCESYANYIKGVQTLAVVTKTNPTIPVMERYKTFNATIVKWQSELGELQEKQESMAAEKFGNEKSLQIQAQDALEIYNLKNKEEAIAYLDRKIIDRLDGVLQSIEKKYDTDGDGKLDLPESDPRKEVFADTRFAFRDTMEYYILNEDGHLIDTEYDYYWPTYRDLYGEFRMSDLITTDVAFDGKKYREDNEGPYDNEFPKKLVEKEDGDGNPINFFQKYVYKVLARFESLETKLYAYFPEEFPNGLPFSVYGSPEYTDRYIGDSKIPEDFLRPEKLDEEVVLGNISRMQVLYRMAKSKNAEQFETYLKRRILPRTYGKETDSDSYYESFKRNCKELDFPNKAVRLQRIEAIDREVSMLNQKWFSPEGIFSAINFQNYTPEQMVALAMKALDEYYEKMIAMDKEVAIVKKDCAGLDLDYELNPAEKDLYDHAAPCSLMLNSDHLKIFKVFFPTVELPSV